MSKKILIIEDEQVLSEMLERHLSAASFEVTCESDGQEGLKKIHSEKPDLVLLDITLPSINGTQILDELQKNRELSAIPVVIMSNSDEPHTIANAISGGARDYIVKANLTPSEVVEKIQQALSGTEAAAESVKKTTTVLVIEDEEILSDLAKIVLSEHFTVETAKNGIDALKMAEEIKPDVFLIDIILPDANGFDVLKELRSNHSFDESVCIMFTNLGQTEDIEKAESLGADAYYVKANLNIKLLPDVIKDNLLKKKQNLKEK